MAAEPWEVDDENLHLAWERDGYSDDEGEDDDDDDDEDMEMPLQDLAVHEFLEVLLDHYLAGAVVTAKTFCTLCHWAELAGMGGEVAKYSKKPGCSTGDYARHLERELGFRTEKDKLYKVNTVGHPRREIDRTPIDVPMRLPHVVLEEEVATTPSVGLLLDEQAEAQELPPPYASHPVVERNRGLVLPISIYMDGVKYSNVDSAIGMWMQNHLTNKRSLLCVVRKSMLCKCGCRGRCTWWPIMTCLKWSLLALATGRRPDRRHDGNVLHVWELSMQDVARSSLGFFRGGDLLEGRLG